MVTPAAPGHSLLSPSLRAASAASPPGLIETDMSNEALESHHMVVVMAVLVCCPHLKRLRLDGNKVCVRV